MTIPKESNVTSLGMSELKDRLEGILRIESPDITSQLGQSKFIGEPVLGRVPLIGNPLLYPFDNYHINMTVNFPESSPSLNKTEQEIDIGPMVNASWKRVTHSSIVNETENINGIDYKLPPVYRVSADFERNYIILLLIVPLVAIFYLLGASFIFDNTIDRLGNRLALTLGIIALIFTLNNIIDRTKPITSGPTIADSILSIAIIAAIVFPIISIQSSSPIIQKRFSRLYGFIDVIMFVIMSGIAIGLLSNYDLDVTKWLLPVIIFGLGYGLLVRKISFSKIKSIMLVKGNPDRHDFY